MPPLPDASFSVPLVAVSDPVTVMLPVLASVMVTLVAVIAGSASAITATYSGMIAIGAPSTCSPGP